MCPCRDDTHFPRLHGQRWRRTFPGQPQQALGKARRVGSNTSSNATPGSQRKPHSKPPYRVKHAGLRRASAASRASVSKGSALKAAQVGGLHEALGSSVGCNTTLLMASCHCKSLPSPLPPEAWQRRHASLASPRNYGNVWLACGPKTLAQSSQVAGYGGCKEARGMERANALLCVRRLAPCPDLPVASWEQKSRGTISGRPIKPSSQNPLKTPLQNRGLASPNHVAKPRSACWERAFSHELHFFLRAGPKHSKKKYVRSCM